MHKQEIMTIAFDSGIDFRGKTGELFIRIREKSANSAHEHTGAKMTQTVFGVKGICFFTVEPLRDCDIRNNRGKGEICPYSLETCV